VHTLRGGIANPERSFSICTRRAAAGSRSREYHVDGGPADRRACGAEHDGVVRVVLDVNGVKDYTLR